MKKGIIVPAGIHIVDVEGNSFRHLRGYSDLELQYLALYWDKIVIPENNLISFGNLCPSEYIETGMIEIVPTSVQAGGEVGKIMADSYNSLASNYIEKQIEGIAWSPMQLGESSIIQKSFAIRSDLIKLELNQVLPVPNVNVNIHEILDFKDKRKDELIALRLYLDEIYLEILSSPDVLISAEINLEKIRNAIQDLDKSFIERFKTYNKQNLSISLEVSNDTVSSLVGGLPQAIGADALVGWPFPFATIGHVVNSFLKIKLENDLIFKSGGNNNLSYISSMINEL